MKSIVIIKLILTYGLILDCEKDTSGFLLINKTEVKTYNDPSQLKLPFT
jgi:hypothetical protein